MSLKMRKQSADSVDTPDASHEQIFIDENGNPSRKNSGGFVDSLISLDGSPLPLDGQVVDPVVVPGIRGVLYSKLVSGVIELFFRDDVGQNVQITNNGGVAGASTEGKLFTPRWSDAGIKTGLPGEYWEDTETCNAQYGDSIQLDVRGTEAVIINLPVMTAADAGKQINVVSTFDNDKGGINYGGYPYGNQYAGVSGWARLVPQPGDSIMDCVTAGPGGGEQVMNYWNPASYEVHLGPWSSTIMADGNNRWVVTAASRVFTNAAAITYGP